MTPLPTRIARSLIAGLLGAVKAVALLAATMVIGFVAVQVGMRWYVTGTLSLPPVAPAPNTGVPLPTVLNATPAEAAAIRAAVNGMRFRLPPRALDFSVTDEPCPECGAEYWPALGLIEIQRSIVDEGGPALQRTVAHEIGHFVDESYLHDSQRDRYRRLRHIPPNRPWFAPDLPWEDSPSEDFAEVFAVLNVTIIDSSLATSYGPVRNPDAFERLLDSVGVHLGRASSPTTWRTLVTQELAFASHVAESEASWRRAIEIVIVAYALFAAISDGRRAWLTHRGTP